jgi:hypothetical protein
LRAPIDAVPAIQPALLRQQAALLAEHFADPLAYVRSLHYLLDFYADRARRSGQSGMPAPITSAYNVRPPVIRMILQELTPLANQSPEQGLALCDALWAEPMLEFRQLAAMLLGQIPPSPPERIITRLKTWLVPDLEFYLIEELMNHALERLRQEHPQSMVRLIQDWLESSKPLYQQLGLRALLPLVENPQFENLPVFFRLVQPLSCNVPPGLKPDLLDVLAALVHRSPQEAVYFLRQTLTFPDAADTGWLIRQLLNEFPPENQQMLRDIVKEVEPRRSKS